MKGLSIAAAIVGLLYVGEYLQGQEASLTERVEVRRALIDVRVTDQGGQVVPHLRSEDFIVRIDGKAAQVRRADWHGTPMQSNASSEQPGRCVVFFVQRTLDRNVAAAGARRHSSQQSTTTFRSSAGFTAAKRPHGNCVFRSAPEGMD